MGCLGTELILTIPLRGLEGLAARHYFCVFGSHIKPDWAKFKERSKKPPLTNVNAVLSFLYSLLAQEVLFATQMQGLDSMVGTLHELCYGRNSLVYDLMEEFRTPIADTLCCHLFNDRILNPNHFEFNKNAVYLTKDGIKEAVTAFELKMNRSIRVNGSELTYRMAIVHQAELYKNFILGKTEKYETFVYK